MATVNKKLFCKCKCIFTNNIFLQDYKLLVNFINEKQFKDDYSELLIRQGCKDLAYAMDLVRKEIDERQHQEIDALSRKQLISHAYSPLHPEIFSFSRSFCDQSFLQLVEFSKKLGVTKSEVMKQMRCHGDKPIFSFKVFSPTFCELLLRELKNFENSEMPKGRPNTMNSYGINLDEFGFDPFITELRTNYITPLMKILFPDWGGDDLDSHKAFVVTYRKDQDTELSYHYDNAEITLNIALNEDFCDGELYFGPMHLEESQFYVGYAHQLGQGVFHRGQQMHGAMPITEGERYNLIIWLRSSRVRNQCCPMCNHSPNLFPVIEGHGDGFTQETVHLCSLT